MSTPATADEHNDEEEDDDYDEEADVDELEGFEVEVIAEHASFPDDVDATFEITYPDDNDEEPVVVDPDDASTVILAEATWEEGARFGWHRHPGTSIVRMLEGEIEHMMEDDRVPRTYSAGDAWIDPGYVHRADSENGARSRHLPGNPRRRASDGVGRTRGLLTIRSEMRSFTPTSGPETRADE